MSWIHHLALRGRLSDRLTRRAVRRRALARPDRAEKEAVAPADGRSTLLEQTQVPALWGPGTAPRSVPDEMTRLVLGDHGLEAAAHWPIWAKDLATAKKEMLGLIAERAAVRPDQRVLVVAGRRDAVGSYLAEELSVDVVVWTPHREDAQRIGGGDGRRGLGEMEIRAGRLLDTVEETGFDRIVAIESLPPDADPRAFLGDLASRLRPGGRLFLQLACHRRYDYTLSRVEARWLDLEADILVPATDLAPRLTPNLVLHHHWELSGEHYERTFRAWRRRLEERRSELVAVMAPALGDAVARRTLDHWRLSLLARETTFGARGGQEWWISHYALDRPLP